MQQQYADQVTFIGVGARDEPTALADFVDTYQVGGFEHASDVDGVVWDHYNILSQPAFAFIDDDGTVTVQNGALGEDDLVAKVEELLAT